jgi:molybdenum cofactor cytidylyltransferase
MSAGCGIIILAAGASTRLGSPKQLLRFENSSLLERTISCACQTGLGPVVVVLGANAESLKNTIPGKEIITVFNGNWQEGMASSIRAGLDKTKEAFPLIEGVIITVCDQPFITSQLLNDLYNKHKESRKPVVAAAYRDILGTPVFFHRSLFDELNELKGDRGAKQIVNKGSSRLASVPFPMGETDIDTKEDYERLLQNKKA